MMARKRPTAILESWLRVPRPLVRRQDYQAFTYELPPPPGADPDTPSLEIETFVDQLEEVWFPRGNLKKITRLFASRFRIVDRRAWQPIPDELLPVFGRDGHEQLDLLHPEQRLVLKKWLDKGAYGIVQAPPRWGKTVWLAALVTLLGQRTLLLAHTIDLVQQAVEEFRRWTNVGEIERLVGRPLAGVMQPNGRPYEVFTGSTWQTLYTAKTGKKMLAKLKDYWGLVVVDEAHRVAAECYTHVVSNLNPYYRLGLTATPHQTKTQLHLLAFDVLGPVTAKGTTGQMSVEIRLTPTGRTVKQFRYWATYLNQLARDNVRNKFICQNVLADVGERRVVLVLTDRIKHCRALKDLLLQEQPDLRVEIITGQTPKGERAKIRARAKRGEVDVIVGMNSILQLGFNVPILSSLHNVMPVTSPENWLQRLSRVRTRMTDEDEQAVVEKDRLPKPMPRVWVYYDQPNLADRHTDRAGYIWAYVNLVKRVAAREGFKIVQLRPPTEV